MLKNEKIMDKIIHRFLDLPNLQPLFTALYDEAIDVLINLEMLLENKLDLDKSYHTPKKFILNINNIIRNIMFSIEHADKAKQRYRWLYDGIQAFKSTNKANLAMFSQLRNMSVHHKLILPEGAFTCGLYRIKNNRAYKQKMGMLDVSQNLNVCPKLVYSNTVDIFHKLLLCHFLLFIDIDHASIGECLGITRKWNYQVTYKLNKQKVKKAIDLYIVTTAFLNDLFNTICRSFSEHIKLPYKTFSLLIAEEFNFINTLLEIDLYPNLFSSWWRGNSKPLNWQYLLDYNKKVEIDESHSIYEKMYNLLPNNLDEYIAMLKKYKDVQIGDFKNMNEYNHYIYFVSMHHWYISRVDKMKLLYSNFDFKLLVELQQTSEDYILNIESKFNKTTEKEKNVYLDKFNNLLQKIYNEITNKFKLEAN